MPRLLRRDIRHDPSIRERISQELIHCARIRKQIAEDLTNLYSVLEFGGGDTLVHLDVRMTSLLWWPTCSQLQTAALDFELVALQPVQKRARRRM